ncbi:MAG: DUF2905 domain-containing protein [Saprospiraceae bacterium]|nr:DUF2905 domain-containing protein [Saprospiraceae bacterium]
MNPEIAKWIITAGLMITVTGIIMYFYGNVFAWFGRLPGDIRIERENFSFFFPITSMILISVALTIIFRLIRQL